ncbi:uncharacterized protein V1510DRAFT_415421 [Dipodascopsis tothii]|uniref:uncharacterized protein n=1 Tax=Dipodascopsis tothii TaxID=44089 RepID=UPI0034CFD6D8
MAETYGSCAICNESLLVPFEAEEEHEHDGHDHGHSHSSTAAGSLVPDDVEMPCPSRHHFHWQCLLDHTQPATHCPACGSSVVAETGEYEPVLVTITNDGGVETDYDIRQTIEEERFYAANPNQRMVDAFCSACFLGDEEIVLEMWQKVVAAEATAEFADTRDKDKGWTALHFAAVAGQLGVCTFLVEQGWDRAAVDVAGRRPVDYAAEEGYGDDLMAVLA